MLGTGNYASIMKVFTKTIEKLKERSSKLQSDIKVNEVTIRRLSADNLNANIEAQKCNDTAVKLEELCK